MGEKRARHEPHSECLHNGIILIVYIFQIVLQRYNFFLIRPNKIWIFVRNTKNLHVVVQIYWDYASINS